jgi:hypothetical protein
MSKQNFSRSRLCESRESRLSSQQMWRSSWKDKKQLFSYNRCPENRENQCRSKNKIQGENLRSNTMFVLLRFLILYSGFVQHKFSQIWSNSYNTAGERKIKFENLIASFGTTFHSLVGAQVQQKKYELNLSQSERFQLSQRVLYLW